VEDGVDARNVNGILGLLCREHFPGLVWSDDVDVLPEAPTFDMYATVSTDPPYRNLVDRVILELWVSLSRTTALNLLHSLHS
jgi:hypothetical protein